ncbi:MAG TPA: hypothetical protein VM386_00810 [Acidimicrobiales bacterium]|nr:hypothetical protein [Acidimicrobiales bacterium]
MQRSKSAVSGSTTFVNAQVALATDADGSPTVFEDIPQNPPVNYTRSGVLSNVGDVFTVVYNEQIVNSDGSLTVNRRPHVPVRATAVGDVVKGSVTCGVTRRRRVVRAGHRRPVPPREPHSGPRLPAGAEPGRPVQHAVGAEHHP